MYGIDVKTPDSCSENEEMRAALKQPYKKLQSAFYKRLRLRYVAS